MTFAYRTLSLIVCSFALSVVAEPITPDDIRVERKIIPKALAQEKAEAVEIFRASQQPLLYRRALAGISRIEDKLANTATNAASPSADMKLVPLGDKRVAVQIDAMKKIYTAHQPTNGLPTFLDTKSRRSPEAYLSPDALAGGVNILAPKGTLQVPACLGAGELENYLRMRCDRKFQTGDYWKELHAGRLNEEELACLRYYDYLDANVPLRSVPVYQCTEIQGRNH
ncbi:MAG: hypothetical protein ABS95_02375 [Verrucomicrobia bacterium SCN 57-15]|nr:MAG: hypothetical protein ABS95_02375 [Verrucomicrobia bacterium SCN 57-15]